MEDLRVKQKEQAIERMKKLGIMEQPIKEFEDEDKLNLSEVAGYLYWLDDDEKEMVKKFEEENNALVYHIIKTNTNIGMLYNLLYVSEYVEEWDMDMDDLSEGQALAYVLNKTMPDCSEFGTIGIKPSVGGLIRTW